MSEKRKKRAGVKLFGFIAGAILMMGIVSSWLSPCSGMDALTQSELGELSAQVGIDIGFCDTTTNAVKIRANFQTISFGDTDGWGNGIDQHPGWIILRGRDSTKWGQLFVALPSGAQMSIDAASTGSCTYTPGSGYGAIRIPPDTPFFTFSLTETKIGLINPTTVEIVSSDTSDPRSNSLGIEDANKVGWIKPDGLAIELDPYDPSDSTRGVSRCYIWPH
jgi:hypothetical protein